MSHNTVPDQVVHKISRLLSPPPYVKTASAPDLVGDAQTNVWADPVRHQYPCHTKAATWFSLARRVLERAEDGHDPTPEQAAIDNRLVMAKDFFNLDDDFAALTKAAQLLTRDPTQDLTDVDFALVVKDLAGQPRRFYRLMNPGEIKAAAAYLAQHQNDLDPSHCQQMAGKILDKAALYQVAGLNQEWLCKQAGRGVNSGIKVARFLYDRVKTLRPLQADTDLLIKLAELARHFVQKPELCHEEGNLRKLAAFIDNTDRAFGLDKTTLPKAHDVFFDWTYEKMAAVRQAHCGLQSGSIYQVDDLLHKLGYESIKTVFGTKLADDAFPAGMPSRVKLAAALERLDRREAEEFDRLARQHGCQPVYRQNATPKTVLSDLIGMASKPAG
jgi:hypothetical protein